MRYRLPILCLLSTFLLAWSSPALCGPIHNAAKIGDLATIKTLLKRNHNLISSRDKKRLDCIAFSGA